MTGFDVAVRGDGVVARTLALALGRHGVTVALPLDDAPRADLRAYALNAASVALLDTLKVWQALPDDARTPVYDMRIAGDAPGARLAFSAWQQRVGELAWIVDASALLTALGAALRYAPHVTLTREAVPASLLTLAEGRASAARDALGVPFERHDYGQQAIAARLVSDREHQGTARQWFRAPDVLALLPFDRPMPAHSYALVWSLPDVRANELLAADAAAFEQALAEASHGAAGTLRLASERAAWPLATAHAESVCGPGWVLLGDAAHVVHPLAGQGLNLGLADVAVLARVVAAREPWRTVGDPRLLRRYARERAAATRAMGAMTDGLLRLFAADAAPLRELRNRGLTLVDHLPPLKRWLAAHALDS
jgi:2-polyprenyl-6-methoxyphenol hydroxylase-like FAD-dependent oxidoreductase